MQVDKDDTFALDVLYPGEAILVDTEHGRIHDHVHGREFCAFIAKKQFYADLQAKTPISKTGRGQLRLEYELGLSSTSHMIKSYFERGTGDSLCAVDRRNKCHNVTNVVDKYKKYQDGFTREWIPRELADDGYRVNNGNLEWRHGGVDRPVWLKSLWKLYRVIRKSSKNKKGQVIPVEVSVESSGVGKSDPVRNGKNWEKWAKSDHPWPGYYTAIESIQHVKTIYASERYSFRVDTKDKKAQIDVICTQPIHVPDRPYFGVSALYIKNNPKLHYGVYKVEKDKSGKDKLQLEYTLTSEDIQKVSDIKRTGHVDDKISVDLQSMVTRYDGDLVDTVTMVHALYCFKYRSHTLNEFVDKSGLASFQASNKDGWKKVLRLGEAWQKSPSLGFTPDMVKAKFTLCNDGVYVKGDRLYNLTTEEARAKLAEVHQEIVADLDANRNPRRKPKPKAGAAPSGGKAKPSSASTGGGAAPSGGTVKAYPAPTKGGKRKVSRKRTAKKSIQIRDSQLVGATATHLKAIAKDNRCYYNPSNQDIYELPVDDKKVVDDALQNKNFTGRVSITPQDQLVLIKIGDKTYPVVTCNQADLLVDFAQSNSPPAIPGVTASVIQEWRSKVAGTDISPFKGFGKTGLVVRDGHIYVRATGERVK